MADPRIVFTCSATLDLAILDPWREHRGRVVRSTAEAARPARDAACAAVVWQLVSANNRELARSADVFDDYQDAVISANEAVQFAGSNDVVPVSDPITGGYGWYIRVLGLPAVVCGRWYLAERERRHSLRLTLESIPLARLTPGARRYVGRNTMLSRALV